MIRLAHYVHKDGAKEYVVIITEDEPEEYARPGYTLSQVVEIVTVGGKLTTFPLNTILMSDES